jgi:hypothetical protein
LQDRKFSRLIGQTPEIHCSCSTERLQHYKLLTTLHFKNEFRLSLFTQPRTVRFPRFPICRPGVLKAPEDREDHKITPSISIFASSRKRANTVQLQRLSIRERCIFSPHKVFNRDDIDYDQASQYEYSTTKQQQTNLPSIPIPIPTLIHDTRCSEYLLIFLASLI